MDSLINELGAMSTDVSPMRSTVINSASSTRGSSVNRKLTDVYAESFCVPSSRTARFLRRVSEEDRSWY